MLAPKGKDAHPTNDGSDTIESLEDFLKKISQGQQTATQQKPSEQPFQEIAPPPPPPPIKKHVEKIKTIEHTVSQADVNERVSKLYEERKRELEETYHATEVQSAASDAYIIKNQTTEAVRIRNLLINDLKDKESLMKAVVLKEILDVPLGLRRTAAR